MLDRRPVLTGRLHRKVPTPVSPPRRGIRLRETAMARHVRLHETTRAYFARTLPPSLKLWRTSRRPGKLKNNSLPYLVRALSSSVSISVTVGRLPFKSLGRDSTSLVCHWATPMG